MSHTKCKEGAKDVNIVVLPMIKTDVVTFDIFPGLKISKLIPSKQNLPFPEYLCLHVQSKLPIAGYFQFVW